MLRNSAGRPTSAEGIANGFSVAQAKALSRSSSTCTAPRRVVLVSQPKSFRIAFVPQSRLAQWKKMRLNDLGCRAVDAFAPFARKKAPLMCYRMEFTITVKVGLRFRSTNTFIGTRLPNEA